MMNTSKKRKNWLRWWWMLPIVVMLVLFTALSIVVINIDSIAHTQINKLLNTRLVGGGSLDAIHFQLKEGRLAINGLTINSPQKFGSTPLLQLETLVVNLQLGSLLHEERIVEEIVLKDLSFVVIRNGVGELNVLSLVPPGEAEAEPDAETNVTNGESDMSIPSVHINTTRLENIRIAFINQLPAEQWSTELRLDLAVDDLKLRDLMNMDVLSGKIELALSEFRAGNPPGFGRNNLASLAKLEVKSDGLDLGAPEMVIANVLVQEPSLSLVIPKDGISNWERLGQILNGSEQEPANAQGPEERPGIFKRMMDKLMKRKSKPAPQVAEMAPAGAPSEAELPIIVLSNTRLEGGAFTYRDDTLTKEGLVFPVTDIQFETTGLRVFETSIESPPAAVSGSLKLSQPEGQPTALLGLLGAIGPVGAGIPLINTQVRVTGFKLDTLGSLVPPATKTVLGANGMDVDLSLAMNTESLNLKASMLTDKDVKYNAIKVKGPLDAPKVEVDKILAGVLSRFSSGLVGLGRGGLHAGVDIASGGVEMTKGVGSGVVRVGTNIVKGLLDVGKGVVTLDKEQVKEGLTETTVDTVVVTVDSAKNVGSATGHGLTRSYSNLKGEAREKAWNQDIPARHNAAMKRAKTDLTKMPYPPVTE